MKKKKYYLKIIGLVFFGVAIFTWAWPPPQEASVRKGKNKNNILLITEPVRSEVAAGMTAEFLINIKSTEALSVPVESNIDTGSNRSKVFSTRDERPPQITIKLGQLSMVSGEMGLTELISTGCYATPIYPISALEN